MTHEEYIEQEFAQEIQSAYTNVYSKYYAMCNDSKPSGHCLEICKEVEQITRGIPSPFSEPSVRIIGGLVGCGIEHWWIQCGYFIIDDFYPTEIHEPKTELINGKIAKN